MEKRVVVRGLALILIFAGLIVFLLVLKNVNFTGYAVYTKTDAGSMERRANWDKIDNGDGSYDLIVYSAPVNYYDGEKYVPIVYGSCGSNCFRDWNGLIYRISSDEKKAYIELYNINDNLISRFGFGITGNIGGTNYQYTTLNFTWIWSLEIIGDEYVFRAWNNRTNFNWTQEFHFYPNQSMKIKNTIKNNLGASIQNAKFWYIQTVGEDDGIWFNGTRYATNTYKTGESDSLLPQVKFEDYYVFEYNDLLENGFNITDFYLGDGNVIGVNGVRILAIGITKGNSVFPTGVSVSLDPTMKLIGSGGGGDAYVRGDKPTTNYGSDSILLVKGGSPIRNSYLIFNISSIPENQKVDNATLCSHLYQDEASQNISAHHVYADWQENVITWNNQPCGTNFDNSTNCNLTAESSLSNDGNQENTWQCWDVKNMVGKEYENNSKKVSIALYTIDIGNADEFYSKEYSNSSLWPYLNITYSLKDLIAPNLTIISPGNLNYNNATILVNISAKDPNLNKIWWFNGSDNLTYTSKVYYTFQEGSNSLVAYANDSMGNENSSSVSFFVDSIAPALSITLPQEGASYGYNNSISLNYSAFDLNLGNCWYNVDNGNNISLSNCQNTTFDVSGNGNYIVKVYANDSLGSEGLDSASFSVQIGAPTIILNSPIDKHLSSQNIEFNYAPTDIDLQACELWGNFDGEFKLNQTDTSSDNGVENSFSLYLEDGVYLWNIKCNDSQGNSAFNGNKTFYIDTLAPSLSLSEPSGTKTSRIVIASWSVSDINLQSCWYNVYRGASLEIANTSINCSVNSVSFNVTVDASFVFNFYVNDSAGNFNSTSSSFSVDTSTPVSPPPGGGGGGGGGGGSISNVTLKKDYNLELSRLSNLIIDPGESKKIILSVQNVGKNFLNDCKIKGKGENAAWISSEGLKGLSVGEKKDFIFTLKVPEGLKAGSYNIELSLACQEYNESISFIAEIIEKKLAVELIKAEREDKDKVRIVYSLSELSGVDQDVETEIVLFGKGDERLAEIRDTKHIEANSKEEFEAILNVDESLEGSFNLLINGVSQISSTFVQEEIILGASRVGGFAIFGGVRGETVFSIVLVTIFIIFSIFILRRILKFRKLKKTGHRKGAMVIDSRVVEKLKKQLEGQNHKGK